MKLENKKIVVTGAANGIGSEIFIELLKENAHPIGIDVKPIEGSALERKLKNSNNQENSEFYQCDASNQEEMNEVFKNINYVDGLVNNAGLCGGDSSLGGRSINSWNKMVGSHALSAFIATELSYPKIKNGGSIVNIGSLELSMADKDVVLYVAAKGALHGLTVGYAVSLAPEIRVNMVSPGDVRTEQSVDFYSKPENHSMGQKLEQRTLLKRSVKPKEIADTVLYLLSDRSSAITGEDISVDGGYKRSLL